MDLSPVRISCAARWDDITHASTCTTSRRHDPSLHSILMYADLIEGWRPRHTRLGRHGPTDTIERIEAPCDRVTVPSLLVFQLLRFYVRNRKARWELGTNAAITRLREHALGD